MGSREKTYGYQERDKVKRLQFREEIGMYEPESIVYIDEAGMDNRKDYGYGWNEKGQRFHPLKSGKREGRVNMIAAYSDLNSLQVKSLIKIGSASRSMIVVIMI